MGLFEINTIMQFTPDKVLLFMLLGGLAYLFGVIYSMPGNDTPIIMRYGICFVLTGSVMHFFGIWYAIEH
jgi:predicted membrane channel-forming protein YqfA (hemolysin III family)